MQTDVAKPKRLGRGLSSLMDLGSPVRVNLSASRVVSVSENGTIAEPPPTGPGLLQIPVNRISPNPFQPREAFGEDAIARLADSIARSGLMQPIVVRPGHAAADFEIVAGERRWRAAQRAGMSVIPAMVRDLTDAESAEWAVVENIQREDLNPIDRGRGLKNLAEKFGLTHDEIGSRVGLERSTVANLIRLLELEPEIQRLIADSRLGQGHGKALLGMPAGPERASMALESARSGWNVRRLETEVRRAVGGKQKLAVNGGTSVNLERLEKELGQYLGTKVRIQTDRTGKRGTLTIDFYGLDHFDGLVAKMGFRGE